ncbi:MAG: dTMP kinase [Alphaproteobacteria bacterium]|nr:dTMP kinase [Alphaproteobacteria bacterium]
MTNNALNTYGTFITLEGGEGAGKTTQIARLKNRLEALGKKVITTREPGGSVGAEAIRKLLVEGDTHRWDAMTEAMLLFAARRDHVEKVIAPALARGDWVISDRFYDSSTAYQGYGQGLELSKLDELRKLSIGELKPDVTFILDLPVEVGLKRAAVEQRYERMGTAFHEKLRQGFLTLAKAESGRIKVIDATQTVEVVENAIFQHISSFI